MSVVWTDDYEIFPNNMMADLPKNLDQTELWAHFTFIVKRQNLEKSYAADLFKSRKFI